MLQTDQRLDVWTDKQSQIYRTLGKAPFSKRTHTQLNQKHNLGHWILSKLTSIKKTFWG